MSFKYQNEYGEKYQLFSQRRVSFILSLLPQRYCYRVGSWEVVGRGGKAVRLSEDRLKWATNKLNPLLPFCTKASVAKKCENLKLRPRLWAFRGQPPFPTPSTCTSNLHPTAENCKGTEKEKQGLKVLEHFEEFQHQYLSALSLANFLITVSPGL